MKHILIALIAIVAIVAGSSITGAEYLGDLPSVVSPVGLEDGQYSVEYDNTTANVSILNINKDQALLRITSNPDAPAFKFSNIHNSEIPAILMFQMGDTNNNVQLDVQDFIFLGNAYGTSKGQTRYRWIVDFNLDGKIDFSDYLIFVTEYRR